MSKLNYVKINYSKITQPVIYLIMGDMIIYNHKKPICSGNLIAQPFLRVLATTAFKARDLSYLELNFISKKLCILFTNVSTCSID